MVVVELLYKTCVAPFFVVYGKKVSFMEWKLYCRKTNVIIVFACFVQEKCKSIKKGEIRMPYGYRWDWLWDLIGGKDDEEEE